MNLLYNVDRQYQELLLKIIDKGKEKGDRTGTGTISTFSHTLEIDMAQGFPLLTTKKMYVRGIIHELLWFLNGDTNIQYLVRNGVNIWTPDAYREYKKQMEYLGDEVLSMDEFKEMIINNDKFAEMYGELGPVYGKQWVNWGGYEIISGKEVEGLNKGINQIQNAIDTLNNNPDSRRIIVSAWNVGEIDEMALPPCHWAFELYTEELTLRERIDIAIELELTTKTAHLSEEDYSKWCDKKDIPKRRLSLKWHQRSVDSGLGLPFNISSYGFLLHMIAQQVNMVPHMLVGDLTNVHIYNNHIDTLKSQLTLTPYELPTLELNKAEDIFSYTFDDFVIKNYKSHPILKMNISV